MVASNSAPVSQVRILNYGIERGLREADQTVMICTGTLAAVPPLQGEAADRAVLVNRAAGMGHQDINVTSVGAGLVPDLEHPGRTVPATIITVVTAWAVANTSRALPYATEESSLHGRQRLGGFCGVLGRLARGEHQIARGQVSTYVRKARPAGSRGSNPLQYG